MPMTQDEKCPDGGACHHDCGASCFRVVGCGPLSGVYPDDMWPLALVNQHRMARGLDPIIRSGTPYHVRKIKGERPGLPVEPGDSVRMPSLVGKDTWTVLPEPAGPGMVTVRNERTREVARAHVRSFQEARGDFRGPTPPDEVQVVWTDHDGTIALVLLAETPDDLISRLARAEGVLDRMALAEVLRLGFDIGRLR